MLRFIIKSRGWWNNHKIINNYYRPQYIQMFSALMVAIISCVYICVTHDSTTHCTDDVRCNDWTTLPDFHHSHSGMLSCLLSLMGLLSVTVTIHLSSAAISSISDASAGQTTDNPWNDPPVFLQVSVIWRPRQQEHVCRWVRLLLMPQQSVNRQHTVCAVWTSVFNSGEEPVAFITQFLFHIKNELRTKKKLETNLYTLELLYHISTNKCCAELTRKIASLYQNHNLCYTPVPETPKTI